MEMNVKSTHIKVPNTNIVDFERLTKEIVQYRARISESPNRKLEVKFINYEVLIEISMNHVINVTRLELKELIEIGKLANYIQNELEEDE